MSIATKITEALTSRNPTELAHGWLRYETLRKLNPRRFLEISKLNLEGPQFDDIVDTMIVDPGTVEPGIDQRVVIDCPGDPRHGMKGKIYSGGLELAMVRFDLGGKVRGPFGQLARPNSKGEKVLLRPEV
jgi:hypothetical protein